jgi:hypothetical protein
VQQQLPGGAARDGRQRHRPGERARQARAAVLAGPRELELGAVDHHVLGLVPELAQVAAVGVRGPEHPVHERAELLLVRPLGQAGALRVVRREEGRVVGVDYEDAHRTI